MTCGIYAIVNTTNDKVYIGQAQDIEKRWKKHKWGLENKKHNNKHLENSYHKDGKENFNFIILHQCSEDDLNYYETKYISIYETTNPKKGYNKTYGGEGGKPTKETRKKMSECHKGKKHTEEQRKKISEANKGRKHKEESKKKMSESRKDEKHYNAKKIYVYNIISNEIKIYNCRKYLAQDFYENGYVKSLNAGKNYLNINNKYTKVNTKIPFHEYVIFSTQELLDNYFNEIKPIIII